MPAPRRSTPAIPQHRTFALNGATPHGPTPSPVSPRGSVARRVVAAAFAGIAWLALSLQFALLVQAQQQAGNGFARAALLFFFGFFTILTDLLCAILATTHLLPSPPRKTAGLLRQPWLLTSAAASVAIVGATYSVLLRRLWQPTGLQQGVDVALHDVAPVLFLVFWWIAVPIRSLSWRDLPRMLVYPVAYMIYVFARGALTGLYPYFFIDVGNLGYPASLRNTLVLLLAFVAVASLLITINRRRTS